MGSIPLKTASSYDDPLFSCVLHPPRRKFKNKLPCHETLSPSSRLTPYSTRLRYIYQSSAAYVIREFSERVLHRGFIYPVELLAPSNIKLVDPAADAGWGHFGSSCAIQSRPTPATQPLTRLPGGDVETLNQFAVVCWSDRACSVTTAPPEGSRCKHWCRRTPRSPLFS